MDMKLWQALGYKTFIYRDQRDLLMRAIAAGWDERKAPSVLGTYTAEVALEDAARFLLSQGQERA